jgi:ABC-type glycerol-3-phosphate transport system substrate-binding protein
MRAINRRMFLGASGAAFAAAFLSACGGGGSGGPGGGGAGGLRWWDHYSALQNFHKDWAAQQSEALGVQVAYTYNDVTKAPEALQLANQSRQLPDVYSNVLAPLPLAALVRENWVGKLTLSDQVRSSLPEGAFTEGVTSLNGEVYGLPLFTLRQYAAAHWMNRDIITQAGIDPANPPTTYDEYRDACRRIAASNDDVAPMILALNGPARMTEQIDDLAQAGGFPGYRGLLFTTGEYQYQHDAYVNAIEFWKELNDSGYIVAGATNFTVADARSRFAAGVAGFFPDGPWCAGGVRAITPQFLPKMEVGPILTPEAGTAPVVYRNSPSAQFFVAGTSANPEQASALVSSFASAEYQKGLAAGMDQPPLNLDVIDTADVIEPYKRIVGFFRETVKRGPEAIVRNPDVAAVDARRTPVNPTLGHIVQGYLGGDVPDLRAALRQLSDAFTQERERALQAATSEGSAVSLDDWAFPDWQAGADYSYA